MHIKKSKTKCTKKSFSIHGPQQMQKCHKDIYKIKVWLLLDDMDAWQPISKKHINIIGAFRKVWLRIIRNNSRH